MSTKLIDVAGLEVALQKFADERDWQQYHSPKNLVMALTGEVGELVFASPSLTSGYWNKPAETAAALGPAGLRSGDVGFVDADGWVFLIDRKKDMISASGYKVWPRDVEDVLYMHPAVREAAVIGVPDEYRG